MPKKSKKVKDKSPLCVIIYEDDYAKYTYHVQAGKQIGATFESK